MNVKRLLAFVLVLFAWVGSYAQTIQIGSGTAVNTTTSGSPINIYFRSLHCQFVYTKAELNLAGLSSSAAMVTFGMYVAQTPLYAMPNFQIKMKHTTALNPSVYDGLGLTTVYTNANYQPAAGGWDTLALSTPFCWNGNDNILVDICFDQTNPTWNASGQIRVFNSTNGFKYVRTDSSPQCGVATSTVSTDKPQAMMRFISLGAPTSAFTYDTVCVNLPTTFTNQTTATCGNPTYYWDFGSGNSTATNPTYVFPAAGTYPVKLVSTINSNKDSITHVVTVLPRPNPVLTGNVNVCQGDAVTINSNGTGTLVWHIADSVYTSYTSSNLLYIPKGNDTIWMKETSPNGCSENSNFLVINVTPYPAKPNVTKNLSNVCAGDTVTLISSATTGNQWYIKSGTAYILQTGATNQTFKYVASNNFIAIVEVSTPFNCKKRSDDFLVGVNASASPSFVGSPTTGVVPQTVFFTNFTPGSNTYLWNFGDSQTSTLQNPSHTYTAIGNYTVSLRVTPSVGCAGTTTFNNYVVIGAPSSVTDDVVNSQSFVVSPNPASDQFMVSYTLNKSENVSLSLVDISGKTYRNLVQARQNVGTHQDSYDISDLPSGVYMVVITSGNQNIHRKLVVTK